MSGSWASSAAGRPQASHAVGPSGSALTVTWPSGQYQAGIRWPHHSWRETFQSRMLVIQCSQVFSNRSGRIVVRPPRVASRAAAASGPVRTNHCVLSRGSTTSLLRWQRPMTISCGRSPGEVAAGLEVRDDPLPGPRSGRGRRTACPVLAIRASSSRIVGIARPWRWPVS